MISISEKRLTEAVEKEVKRQLSVVPPKLNRYTMVSIETDQPDYRNYSGYPLRAEDLPRKSVDVYLVNVLKALGVSAIHTPESTEIVVEKTNE